MKRGEFMGNPKSISDVDTSKLLSEIEQTNKSIMLAGGEGVGKSYILNRAVVDNNNKLFLVNGSFTAIAELIPFAGDIML